MPFKENMSTMKKLLSDSVVYGLSSIVGRFLNYLLVPLYTYKIAAETGDYGIVTNIYAYTALLLVLLTFGMETTFFYFSGQYPERKKEVFSTVLIAVGTVAALFLAAVLGFGGDISIVLGYGEHPEYIRIMACVVAMDAVQAIFFARLRQEGRAWKFAGLKMGFILLNIGLNLFVFLVAPQWEGKALMQWYRADNQVGYIFGINLVCTALVGLGFIPELKDFSFKSFRPSLLKEMLRYTWPLLLLGLVGILNQVADKILLPLLLPGQEGKVQLGMYGACVKIAMLMAIITQAFRYAYEPFVFGNAKQSDNTQTQAKATKYFVIFTLMAFLVVVCYLDILRYFISPDYWEALRAVPVVMMAEILMGVYFNLSFWYKLNRQTWWGAVMSAVGCAVLFAVNIIFVPRIGYMACAWGGLAGYAVCVLLSYCIGQKKNPVPYEVGTMALYAAIAIGIYLCTRLVQNVEPMWLRLVLNTCLICIYVGIAAWKERELIKKAANKLLRR